MLTSYTCLPIVRIHMFHQFLMSDVISVLGHYYRCNEETMGDMNSAGQKKQKLDSSQYE